MKSIRNHRNINKVNKVNKVNSKTKGKKRFTKRSHNDRKKKTRNFRKKRGNVTRTRRGKKIIGGEPKFVWDQETINLIIKNVMPCCIDKKDSSKKYNDGRKYMTLNDVKEGTEIEKRVSDFLKGKDFFIDYRDVDKDTVEQINIGNYMGVPKTDTFGKITYKDPKTRADSYLLSFKNKNNDDYYIPITEVFDEKYYKNYNDNDNDTYYKFDGIIDRLYYYPLTSRIKSEIDTFRSSLPNYPKIPTFSFGLPSNKDIRPDLVKEDSRQRTDTDSTVASTGYDSGSDTIEKKYILITTIDDMKEKIEGGYSFAKLDDTGNYINYSVCRKNRRNEDEFLCDIDMDTTDTITDQDISDKKIFYF